LLPTFAIDSGISYFGLIPPFHRPKNPPAARLSLLCTSPSLGWNFAWSEEEEDDEEDEEDEEDPPNIR
jgi:hypothetical protein